MPNRQHSRPVEDAEEAEAFDLERLAATVAAHSDKFEQHERAMEAMHLHHGTVAQQIAELSTTMNNLMPKIPALAAEGFRQVLSDPATWQAAKRGMQAGAQQAAGGLVMRALGWALDKAMWTVIGILAIYWIGGLPALLAFFKMVKVTTP